MARGDMIPCGVGEMSSRTACKTGFWWRYQNSSDNAIATNKHIIQIFPFIARSAKYPWSSDLRSSSITVTLTYSANDVRTYSKTLYTKYNWGNVPTESNFSNLNNIGTKLCGLVQSDNNLAGEQSTYHSGYRGFSCKNASNFSEYCSYTRTNNAYPYLDPQNDQTIYGAQFEVPCNNDGTPPTVKVKWNMILYSGHGTISYETNIGLDTIPRASTISQSNSNFVIVKASTASTSESNTITISKYSNTFAHKLLFKIGSNTVHVENVTNNTGSNTESYTITPKTNNTILALMNSPSDLNKTVNVICYTYPNATTRNNDTQNNGTGSIGNKTLSFIIKMEQNDNTKPVINTPVAPTISNPFTVSGTNYALVGRSYLSGIKATYNSLKYGATYSKTYINLSTGENWTNDDNGTTTKSGNIISSVSNIVITAKVVDSRGFESDAKTYTFPSSSIRNYEIPQLIENNIYRSDSNGGVYLKISVKFSKIDISGDKNVNKVIKVIDSASTPNTYTCTWNGSTATGGSYDSSTGVLTMEKNLTGYTITNTYTFTIQFYDAVIGSSNPITTTKGIGTVEDLMNFNSSGKSMAFGGISTRGSSEKVLDNFLITDFKQPTYFSNYDVHNEFVRGKTIDGGAGTGGYYYVCDITNEGQYTSQFLEFTFLQRNRYGKMILKLNGSGTSGAIGSVTAYWVLTHDSSMKAYYILSSNKVSLYVQKSEGYDNMDVLVRKGNYEVGKAKITWINTTVTSLPSGSNEIYGATLRVNITGNSGTATSATKATQDSDGVQINTNYYRKRAWWTNGTSHNANTELGAGGIVFAYGGQHNAGTTGTLVDFTCTSNNYNLQIQGNYSGNKLLFRNKNGDNATWGAWRTVTDEETGTTTVGSTTWNWIKYGSGIAMCFGVARINTLINTKWGNLYSSGDKTLPNFPFSFTAKPVVQITNCNVAGWSAFPVSGNTTPSTTNPGTILLCRGNNAASAQDYDVNIVAWGRWK